MTRGKTWNGAEVLVFGWLGILDSTIAWYANPLFLVSSALFFSKRSAGCLHTHEVQQATIETNGQITVVLRNRDSQRAMEAES